MTDAGLQATKESNQGGSVAGALAALAVAVIVTMQIGTLAKPLGDAGDTRVADWLDLLSPYLVVGCSAWVLLRIRSLTHGAAPDRGSWWLFATGALAFAQGSGIHLAANSIDNAQPTGTAAEVTYLWDEHVGHWVWYLGLILLLAGVARAVLGAVPTPLPRVHPIGLLLAALVGLTLFNNWVEGQTPWLGLAAAAAAVVLALGARGPGRTYLLVVAGTALILLVGWGLYWWAVDGHVFPQFSELGWI